MYKTMTAKYVTYSLIHITTVHVILMWNTNKTANVYTNVMLRHSHITIGVMEKQ